MKRDLAIPALAVLLVFPALSVAGLAQGRLVPSTPSAYYPIALGVCVLFFLGVAPVRGRSWLRPLTLALTAMPFLVFAHVEGSGSLPALGWFVVLGASMLLGFAGRQGTSLAAVLVVIIGGGAVLASGDLDAVPGTLNPIDHPVPDATRRAGPAGSTGATSRAGRPLVATPRGSPPATGTAQWPWWVTGPEAKAIPAQRPVLLMLDGGAEMARPQTQVTLVRDGELDIVHPFQLASYDAVLLGENAWREDDERARRLPWALDGFVRAGGLLIGPAPARGWPPKLAARLRDAGRIDESGAGGSKRLGLGRVARAANTQDLEDLLEARLWVPEVATVFDRRAGGMPRIPKALERWRDRPQERRTQGVLLLAFTLVVGAFAWLMRAPLGLLLLVLLAGATTSVGVVWASPRDPGYRVHGFALDLGGSGGRRIEGLVISAGPRGFERPVRWSGGGALALRGASVTADAAVYVPPGRSAWVLRERIGLGLEEGDEEDRGSIWLRDLLVGDVDMRRVRLGRVEALPVWISGRREIPAATLLYRPAAR